MKRNVVSEPKGFLCPKPVSVLMAEDILVQGRIALLVGT